MLWIRLIFLCTISTNLQLGNSFRYNGYFDNVQVTDDPDTYLPTPQIIRRHGYPSEVHVVQSDDGYLLELHRIPHGRNCKVDKTKSPVLLHHGVLSVDTDWIVNGPEKSLSYLLADRGHDVWLANARGNTYSRSHISLNPKDPRFWNFSFHESGIYDLPAMIDHILEVTNKTQIIHIGHSMGTTIFYVMCSQKPEYNKKIKLHVALAPVALITHIRSAIKYLIPYYKRGQALVDWYNGGSVLEHGLLIKMVSKLMCDREIVGTNLCVRYIIDTLFGTDMKQLNQSILPVFFGHSPAGTSMKTLAHYAQSYNANRFQLYDYGPIENMNRYKQRTPLEYDLTKVTAPAALYYGNNDILAVYQDVKWLYDKLASPVGLYEVPYDQFNHLDFIISIDCNKLLNYPAINLINKTDTPGGDRFIEQMIKLRLRERTTSIGTEQTIRKKSNRPFGLDLRKNEFDNKMGTDGNKLTKVDNVDRLLHSKVDEISKQIRKGIRVPPYSTVMTTGKGTPAKTNENSPLSWKDFGILTTRDINYNNNNNNNNNNHNNHNHINDNDNKINNINDKGSEKFDYLFEKLESVLNKARY